MNTQTHGDELGGQSLHQLAVSLVTVGLLSASSVSLALSTFQETIEIVHYRTVSPLLMNFSITRDMDAGAESSGLLCVDAPEAPLGCITGGQCCSRSGRLVSIHTGIVLLLVPRLVNSGSSDWGRVTCSQNRYDHM